MSDKSLYGASQIQHLRKCLLDRIGSEFPYNDRWVDRIGDFAMPVTFSKGALKEMSTRHISWDEVDSTLAQPDTISMDPEGNIVALKLIHEHIFRIAYKIDAGLRVVKRIGKTAQMRHL